MELAYLERIHVIVRELLRQVRDGSNIEERAEPFAALLSGAVKEWEKCDSRLYALMLVCQVVHSKSGLTWKAGGGHAMNTIADSSTLAVCDHVVAALVIASSCGGVKITCSN